MCVGEGGKNCSEEKCAALLWAITNRFLLHPSRFKWRTFIALIRSFSQPINPAWMSGGKFILRYLSAPLKWFRTKEACSPVRQARRAAICKLQLADIPKPIKQCVYKFADGNLPLPSAVMYLGKNRISNWASLLSTPKKYYWGIDVDGDWFFEDSNLLEGSVSY